MTTKNELTTREVLAMESYLDSFQAFVCAVDARPALAAMTVADKISLHASFQGYGSVR